MPKRPVSIKRLTVACALAAVFAYAGVAVSHYYWVVRWESDIGATGAYLKSGDYDKAIASLQDALRVSPRLGQRNSRHADAWTHEHLGDAYRKKGEFNRAAAEYRAALGIDGRLSSQDGLRRALARDRS